VGATTDVRRSCCPCSWIYLGKSEVVVFVFKHILPILEKEKIRLINTNNKSTFLVSLSSLINEIYEELAQFMVLSKEEQMEERWVDLDHSTVQKWVVHYVPQLDGAASPIINLNLP
jgi:hypothetical protein